MAAAVGQAQSPAYARSTIELDDITNQTGIDFVHYDGNTGQYYLVEAMSAGLALLDFDADGDDDIYFLNGSPIGDASGNQLLQRNALYRNDGQFRFTDVTLSAGVGHTGFGLGVACADFDNDGAPDIYVNNYGPNVLFHNNGDGTFTEVTRQTRTIGGNRVGAGCSFFDMDGDSDLDLYVANYVQLNLTEHRTHVFKGLPSYPSPLSLDAEADLLFRNNGNGTFTDVSKSSGTAKIAGRSMGLATFDYDLDGDIDVMVANDAEENHLLENDGQGVFSEVGLVAGVAFDYKAKPQASMGVEVVDLDSDQRLDLFVTSYSNEFTAFYRNEGSGFFEDKILRTGASEATYPHVTWGVVAADFDNNGSPDLFIAAGDLDDQRHLRGGMSNTTAYRISNLVLQNDGHGQLSDLGQNWGAGAPLRESSRGVVAGDLDGDGRVDLVVLNSRRPPQVLRNVSKSIGRGFIQLELVGKACNRDALGARVTVEQQGHAQTTQTRSGHSYQSENSKVIHFGLPHEKAPVNVSVAWPGSRKVSELSLMPNQRVVIVQ